MCVCVLVGIYVSFFSILHEHDIDFFKRRLEAS